MTTPSSDCRGTGQPASAESFDDLLEKMLAPFLAEYPELQIVVFRPEDNASPSSSNFRAG